MKSTLRHFSKLNLGYLVGRINHPTNRVWSVCIQENLYNSSHQDRPHCAVFIGDLASESLIQTSHSINNDHQIRKWSSYYRGLNVSEKLPKTLLFWPKYICGWTENFVFFFFFEN